MNEVKEFDVELRDVEPQTALALKGAFMPFFEQAEEWASKAKSIVVTSADQKEDIAMARTARIVLKKIRIDLDKTRKSLKEESLRRGRAIDGMANVIKYLIVPIEEHLQEQENFVKNIEQARLRELAENRRILLDKYEVETEHYNLSAMTEDGFQQLLKMSKIGFELQKEAERKAEQERIAKEKAEVEERKRIAEENERLKAEAEERERKDAIERAKREKAEASRRVAEEKERAKHAAQLKAERDRAAKIEAELLEKSRKEEKLRLEAEEKERTAKLAPDKKKLEALAVKITEIFLPEVTTSGARDVLENVSSMLNKISGYIKQRTLDL